MLKRFNLLQINWVKLGLIWRGRRVIRCCELVRSQKSSRNATYKYCSTLPRVEALLCNTVKGAFGSISLIHAYENCFSENLHDMMGKLYPTTTKAQQAKYRSHISKTITAISELECAAQAALTVGPMEYYFYSENICYLGDLSVNSATTADTTEEIIIIMKSKVF